MADFLWCIYNLHQTMVYLDSPKFLLKLLSRKNKSSTFYAFQMSKAIAFSRIDATEPERSQR